MGSTSPAPPIAIVGIGCRYAGIRGPAELWRNVVEERCSVGDVPEERVRLGYSTDRYLDTRPRIPGRISSPKGGFIERPDHFDPLPFGLTPREAAAMEPQARLMLEVVWDAIGDAALPFEALRGERVAVMIGHTAEDFSRERNAVLGEDAAMRGLDVRTAIGYARAAISGRISHQLDLRGPSLTLDTACSSSLYATHLACQSLWRGESRWALAGGVNLFLTPEGSLALSRSGMMANDGRCKAFDAGADGFVRAEGAGVVLLRPLEDARADGDHVYAVIRGTGVSADGRDGGHMMAPGRSGQAQAMRDAYALAGFSPGLIDFVEAHGTGTVIGDPVEIAALGDVMSDGRPAHRPLRVSSIKGNIGHAESASGAAGLIKAALAVEHRQLPPQLHFETPNPQIPWAELPVEVQRKLEPWPHDGPARVGVNSFGISGTNAHVILESAPPGEPLDERGSGGPVLVPITAHERRGLDQLAARLLESVRDDHASLDWGREIEPQVGPATGTERMLRDLAYTMARRQSHHAERLAIVADSAAALERELDAHLAGTPSSATHVGIAQSAGPEPLVFVLPGQGGQWAGMARDLLETQPAFRRSIEAWDAAYRSYVDWSLIEVLSDPTVGEPLLARLSVLQPTLVALQVALADWLADQGIVPDAVVGQSVGEVAAAAIAGALDRSDAARLACRRGAAVERVSGRGAMALAGLSHEVLGGVLESWGGRVEIAGHNGPASTLMAGDREPLQALVAELVADGHFARVLDVDFASHCFHMEPLLEGLGEALAGLAPKADALPFYSTVAGRRVASESLDVGYWLRNLRQPVRFSEAMTAALELKGASFIELSPHPTASPSMREIIAAGGGSNRVLDTLRRGYDGSESLLRLLGALFVTGHEIDLQRGQPAGRPLRPPLYPYQRRSMWFGTRRRADLTAPGHPLLGPRMPDAVDSRRLRFDSILDRDGAAGMGLVERDTKTLVPGSVLVELALAATHSVWSDHDVAIEAMRCSPLGRPDAHADPGDPRVAIQVHVTTTGSNRAELQVYGRPAGASDGRWWPLAEAAIRASTTGEGGALGARSQADAADAKEPLREVAIEWARGALDEAGAGLPRRLDPIREVRLGEDQLIARLELPSACQNDVGHYHLHPVLLEAGIALAGALLEPRGGGARASGFRSMWGRGRSASNVVCSAKLSPRMGELELDFYDEESGEAIARIEGLRTRPADRRSAGPARFVHRLDWAPLERLDSSARASDAVEAWIVVGADAARALAGAIQRALGERCLGWISFDSGDFVEQLDRLRANGRCNAPGLLVLASGSTGQHDPAVLSHFPQLVEADEARWSAAALVVSGPARDAEAAISLGVASVLAERAAPGRRARWVVDVPAGSEEGRAAHVVGLLEANPPSGSWSWRAEGWARHRLVCAAASGATSIAQPSGMPYVARLAADGGGDADVVFHERERRLPGRGEVRVRVDAAAISQLDVRRLLGLDVEASEARRSQRASGLGCEMAGVVSAVGEGVTRLCVGARVAGFAREAIAMEVVTPEAWLARVPNHLDAQQAAVTPLAWGVAERTLVDLARLSAGENVLLLVGSGGVGLAAARVAQRRGARVLAATSSAARRAALRDFGADRVLDFRADDFFDAAASWAGEHGFDVILSSLDDPRLVAVAGLLAPGGRFVDVRPPGKRHMPNAPRLGGNRCLLGFDFEAWLEETPESVAPILQRAFDEPRALREPRIPSITFPVGELSRALRFAAQGRHIGRVAIDLATAGPPRVEPLGSYIREGAEQERGVASGSEEQATWWVSGASVEALERAARLLRVQGARSLQLYPTRPLGDERLTLLERLRGLGLWVDLAELDPSAPAVFWEPVRAAPTGILHVVDDSAVDAEAAAREWAYICQLEAATRPLEDRPFVLVHYDHDVFLPESEPAALRVAGAARGWRALCDALCRVRRDAGGRATSVGLAEPGPESPRVARRRAAARGWLDAGTGGDAIVIPAEPWEWPAGAGALLGANDRDGARGGAAIEPIDLGGLAPRQRAERIAMTVMERLSNVLGLSESARSELDPDACLVDLGLDSLMGTELALHLEADLGFMPAPAFWGERPSARALAAHLDESFDKEAKE